jgi:gluconokinase
MGVSGCGKSTIAALLAQRLGWPMAEADDLHPASNVAKMHAGQPLTDDDRWPWLERVRDWIAARAGAGQDVVVTCSALRTAYRDVLRTAAPRVRFLLLTAPPEVLAERIGHRTGHFMPPSLLPSQLATLEPLGPDEDGVTVDVSGTPEASATAALVALQLP